MPTFEEQATHEYRQLMGQRRAAETSGQIGWCAGILTGTVMLSWAIATSSPGLMIPVVFAIAIGFYAMLRGRQQALWIGSYIEEFHERANGPQWFTRVRRLEGTGGFPSAGDWLTVILANAGVILTVVFAWMDASLSKRGDLMASITTACGVLFGFHSIAETIRMEQANRGTTWRRVGGELHEAERPRQTGSL